jgi:hypothetical protein
MQRDEADETRKSEDICDGQDRLLPDRRETKHTQGIHAGHVIQFTFFWKDTWRGKSSTS